MVYMMPQNKKTDSISTQERVTERSRLRAIAVAVGLTVLAAACGNATTKESTPVRSVAAEASITVPTTVKSPETTTSITSTTPTEVKRALTAVEQLKHAEFAVGKPIGSIKIIATGTRFETDPGVKSYFPQPIKFETPNLENDPVLETSVGNTYKNALTGLELPQPGEKGRAVIFGHRTHESNHPFNALNQLEPNKGQQMVIHRTTEYNEDGSEKTGVDLLFDIIETGVVDVRPEAVNASAQKIFGQPNDPNATEVLIYACSWPDGAPGGKDFRIYALGSLAQDQTPVNRPFAAPATAPLQG
jgi:hypothetical protein